MLKSWDISSEVQRSAQYGERDQCAELLAEIEADSLINSFKEPTEPAPIAIEIKVDSEEQESWGDSEKAVWAVLPGREEIEDGLDAEEEEEEEYSEPESSKDLEEEIEDVLLTEGEQRYGLDALVEWEEEDSHSSDGEEDVLESELSEDSCQEAEDASDIEWEKESWPNAMVEEK